MSEKRWELAGEVTSMTNMPDGQPYVIVHARGEHGAHRIHGVMLLREVPPAPAQSRVSELKARVGELERELRDKVQKLADADAAICKLRAVLDSHLQRQQHD